jgi:membrane associated rhomboid family serine protease
MIPVGTNLSLRKVPFATIGLILVNWAVFAFSQGHYYDTEFWISEYLNFTPGEQHPWQLITSLFLHAGLLHIIGNSIFLWLFGIVVEDKLGCRVYLFLYFLTGIAASLIHAMMVGLFLRDQLFVPSLGASGAISGIMGIYLYRCYYSKIKLLFIFFLLPVRIKIPAWFIMPLWFLQDFIGGIDAIRGIHENVAFWAHVGGFLSGIGACTYLRHETQAWKEKLEFRVETGMKDFEKIGEVIESSEKLVRIDPGNPQGYLTLARAKSRWRGTPEAKEPYEKAILLLLEKDPEQATEVFMEYWKKYLSVLEARYQVRLSLLLTRRGHTDLAAHTLETLISSGQPRDAHIEKALFYLGKIYREQLKREDLARHTYERFLTEFPQSDQRGFVERAIHSMAERVTPPGTR